MKHVSNWLAGAVVAIASAAHASAAVVWVGPAGTNTPTCGASSAAPCQTIQYSVGRTVALDTIRVLPGTYRECVGLTTPIIRLTIVADAFETSGNRAATVIDGTGICDGTGGNFRPAVTLGDGSELRGFTVRGGGDSGVRGFGSVVITRNVITGNSGTVQGVGGGIQAYSTYTYTSSTPLKIEYNDVLANNAPDGGGGVFLRSSGRASRPLRPVSIKGNVVRNNTTSNEGAIGAGILVRTIGSPGGQMGVTVTQNTIEGNGNNASSSAAFSYGGGLAVSAYEFGTQTVTVTGNTIRTNRSGGLGGGLSLFTSGKTGAVVQLTASNNTIEGNTSTTIGDTDGYGGGIWAETFGLGAETIEISGNTVRNNSARLDGGGIAAWAYPSTVGAHTLSVRSNTIAANEAENGAGLQLYLITPDLGAAAAATDLSAEENSITGNTSSGDFSTGGGVYAIHESARTASPSARLRIERNTITGNTSAYAGGGALFWAFADADPDLDGLTETTEAKIRFAGNLVSGNRARDTVDALAVGGGAFAFLQATGPATAKVEMDFNTISGNTSDEGAGGIEVESETDFDVAIADEGRAVFELTNSIVSGNTGSGIDGPSPGDPGSLSQGGTGNVDVTGIEYNDLFANPPGNYATWIGNRTGSAGNLSLDPELDAAFKPAFCSPVVDAADPAAAFAEEAAPNGGRANMGHLGGTGEATSSLPDVNGDGLVDGVDVLRIATSFASVSGQPRYLLPADLDSDGQVDGVDLNFVAIKFGAKCE